MDQVILNQAKSYLGAVQGDKKHKELIDKYNNVKPLPVGYKMKYTDDWCAAFVTVIADLSNASQYTGRECGVHRFTQIFKNKGIWLGVVKPRPGDIVVFDWQNNAWMDHIGFVEKVDGNQITTIEGNTSRRVARRTYAYNDWRINGYARPKYSSGSNNNKKSVSDIASEVQAGKWGNGDTRKTRLTNAGYNYEAVQKEVNRQMNSGNQKKKSNEEIAKEIIQTSKWGNGQTRKDRLTAAGYNHDAIQKIVNKMI